jgi:hypothetical protein
MKNYLSKTALASIIFLSNCCYGQNDEKITSGNYDGMEIKVDKINFYGVINLDDYIVKCELFFWGKLKDNDSVVTIFNPINRGFSIGHYQTLNKKMIIKSNDVLFPCQRVIDLKNGWSFSFINNQTEKYTAFNFIKSEKCLLYTTPNVLTKKKSYLIKNDVVYLFDFQGDWIRVKFNLKNKTFFG